MFTECFKSIGLHEIEEKVQVSKEKVYPEYIQSYSSLLGTLKLRQNNKNELFASLDALKFKLKQEANEYYSMILLGIAKLPFISKMFRPLQLKFTKVDNQYIGYVKSVNSDASALATFFAPLVQIENTEKYKSLDGKCKLITKLDNKLNIFGDAVVKVRKENITLLVKMERSSTKLPLQELDDNLFVVQGFGRSTGGVIPVILDGTGVFINIFGLTYKKEN